MTDTTKEETSRGPAEIYSHRMIKFANRREFSSDSDVDFTSWWKNLKLGTTETSDVYDGRIKMNNKKKKKENNRTKTYMQNFI